MKCPAHYAEHPKTQRTVIVVEDDFLIATYLEDICESFGLRVVGMADNADCAVTLIRENKPDFVLMDFRLKGERDGVDAIVEARRSTPKLKVIYLTGSSEPSTIRRIESTEPHCVLIKPISETPLRMALN